MMENISLSKLYKTIVQVMLLMMVLALASPALASNVVFSTPSIDLDSGETFNLVLSINPKNETNYTASIELNYPADILEINSFEFADSWIAIEQPGYSLIDNQQGVLIKTAGYPKGFTATQPFGTISFVTKKAGRGVIAIGSDSLVLSNTNQNLLVDKSPNVIININDVEIPEVVPETTQKQLFDINLKIDNTNVQDIKDLIARVNFINFGTEPTSVQLTFNIINDVDEVIYTTQDSLTVETEESFAKQFEQIDLHAGIYTLEVVTLYGVDIGDVFRQDFKISRYIFRDIINSVWFLVASFLVLIWVIRFFYFYKKKK